jgi:integral membrane sensor domain MASE1
VFLGAFASALISSTVGALMRLWSGLATPGEYWQIWLVWWTGDAVGILLVTPFLLAIRLWRWPPRLRWYEGVEIGVMLAASLVVPLVALPALDAFYLAFPIIGWAAWRYQLAGVAPCTLIVSVATTNAAVRMVGPFADQDVLMRVLSLQLFNLTLVLGALLFASAISERNSARFEIERTCDRLSEVIDHIEETEAGRRRDGA